MLWDELLRDGTRNPRHLVSARALATPFTAAENVGRDEEDLICADT